MKHATEVDHKVRLADGGTNDLHNLQSLCGECHADKTVGENGGRRARVIGLDGYPAE